MAFSFVQSAKATAASYALSCSLPAAVTPGNILVIGVLGDDGTSSDYSVTIADNAGNSYATQAVCYADAADAGGRAAIAYGTVTASGVQTVTATWSSSAINKAALHVYEFSAGRASFVAQTKTVLSPTFSGGSFENPVMYGENAGDLVVAFDVATPTITGATSSWTTQAGADSYGGCLAYYVTKSGDVGSLVGPSFTTSTTASGFSQGAMIEITTKGALPSLSLSSSVGSVTPEVIYPPVGVFTLVESASSSQVSSQFINLTIPAEPGQMYILACNYAGSTGPNNPLDIQVFSAGSFNDVAGFYGDKAKQFSENSASPVWFIESVIHFGTLTADMLTTDENGNTQLECRAYVDGSGEALFAVQVFDTGNYSNFVVGNTGSNYTSNATSVTTSLTTSAPNSLVFGTSMSWGIGTLNSGWEVPVVLDTPTSGGTVTNYSQQMFLGGGVASGANLTATNTIPSAAQAAVFLLEIVASSMNGGTTLSTLSASSAKRSLSGSGAGSEYLNALGMSSSLNSLISSISGTALAATLAATLLSQSVTTSGAASTKLASLLLRAFAEEIGHSGAAQAALATMRGTSAVGALDPAIEAPIILATLAASLTSSTLTGTGTASQMLPTETLAAVAQAFIASVNVSQTLSALSAIASIESVEPSSGVVASLATQVIAGALGSLSGSGEADTTLSALTIVGLVALFHRIIRMTKASEEPEFKFGSVTDTSPMKISSIEASAIRLGTVTESIE